MEECHHLLILYFEETQVCENSNILIIQLMMPFWFLRNQQKYQHIKYASRKYRMMLTNEQGYSLQIQIT